MNTAKLGKVRQENPYTKYLVLKNAGYDHEIIMQSTPIGYSAMANAIRKINKETKKHG